MQFSIIIPAKNEEANIGRCLDSISAVSWDKSQYEVILVDNGSTDRTVEIAEGKSVRVFCKPELTISGLRNFGARQSTGEVLAFIDADCTVDPGWLMRAASYLSRDSVVCFGSPPIIPDNATWVQKAWFAVRKKQADVCETDWLESMNMFVRRSAFAASGGFDESLITCEDYDLSIRLKQYGQIISDSSIVAVHHGEAATVGRFFRKERWRGTSNLLGMKQHGFSWREFPSVIIPAVYLIVLLICLYYVASILITHDSESFSLGLLLIVFWQVPLLVIAVIKSRKTFGYIVPLQLYVLLNIYFLARGSAFIRIHEG